MYLSICNVYMKYTYMQVIYEYIYKIYNFFLEKYIFNYYYLKKILNLMLFKS